MLQYQIHLIWKKSDCDFEICSCDFYRIEHSPQTISYFHATTSDFGKLQNRMKVGYGLRLALQRLLINKIIIRTRHLMKQL